MNLSIIYNPFKLIESLALKIGQKKRLRKLKNTVGEKLKLGHIDSLELIEIMLMDNPLLKNKAVIYDIGANIGTWTLLAKSLLPDAGIHAFEPLEIHTGSFIKNCGNLDNVFLHTFCLGNQDSSGIINISSYSDSSSLLSSTDLEFAEYGVKKAGEQAVEIKKLSDLIEKQLLPQADIIKLDIQGFELEALKGMTHFINSVKYIICEVSFKQYYHGQAQFLDIANYLADYNFVIIAFGNNTPVGRELNQIDVLFKHSN